MVADYGRLGANQKPLGFVSIVGQGKTQTSRQSENPFSHRGVAHYRCAPVALSGLVGKM